jgi:hypothetical protein
MTRRRVIVGVVVAVGVVAAAVAGWVATRPGPSHPELRQAAVQELPGALGFELAPPPDGFEPVVTPERARVQGTYGERAYRTAVLSLATVRDRYAGTGGTAWVVLTRGICIKDFKGELVQASRSPNKRGLCDDRNLWFEMVDATTGDALMRTRGFDRDLTFQLVRGSA